ncbi:hypothetical protein [Reticulibacter mediterranei]|nr:hypothetical protein [Reticulibacter mediterranei]
MLHRDHRMIKQDVQPDLMRQDDGSAALRDQWADYHEETRLLLESAIETYGKEAAQLLVTALQQESASIQGTYMRRIDRLQSQLDDANTVRQLQERELLRLKATKSRRRIAELERRCAELQEALDRKPEDLAAERTALIEDVLFSGEKIGYQALYVENGVLIDTGFDAYCNFCSSASLEKLRMASEATHLVLQAREGRKKLKRLAP